MERKLKESPSQMTLGKLIAGVFQAKGRVTHSSRSNGVFIKSHREGEFHNIDIVYYGVGPDAAPLPRLAINRNFVLVPKNLFHAWKVSCPWSPFKWWTGLEVTFLPTESAVICHWLIGLVDIIEADSSSDWSKDFPIHLRKITDTNLWTQGAHDYATRTLGANSVSRQRNRASASKRSE